MKKKNEKMWALKSVVAGYLDNDRS